MLFLRICHVIKYLKPIKRENEGAFLKEVFHPMFK